MSGAAREHAEVQAHSWDAERGMYVPATDLVEIRTERLGKKEGFARGRAGRFLKGPIPWDWILRASRLPAKALIVGLCIWRLSGATGKNTVPLSNSEVQSFGIDRAAKSRGLAALERAGLIAVSRKPARWPLVTLLK